MRQARSQDFAQGGGGGGASKGPLPERSKGPFSSVERAPFRALKGPHSRALKGPSRTDEKVGYKGGECSKVGASGLSERALVALRTSKLSKNCASRGLVGPFRRAARAEKGPPGLQGGRPPPAAPPPWLRACREETRHSIITTIGSFQSATAVPTLRDRRRYLTKRLWLILSWSSAWGIGRNSLCHSRDAVPPVRLSRGWQVVKIPPAGTTGNNADHCTGRIFVVFSITDVSAAVVATGLLSRLLWISHLHWSSAAAEGIILSLEERLRGRITSVE